MSNDTTPTRTIDPLEVRLEEFRQAPAAKAFHDLRTQLRASGRGELLAELCATWAPHEADPIRAADAWSEAGEAMLVLGEHDTAIAYLRTALDLDPANERAAERLIELYEADDPAAAVEIVEAEVAELAKRDGARASRASGRPGADTTARRAMQHRRAAELWNDELGRVDRALWHWQQAWRLEPQRTEALEAARVLYASLGDDAMVAKLYQAELDVLGHNGPAPRRAEIRHQLGKLALRAKDLELAAKHLEEGGRLDPSSAEIAETLAEIYATPGFRDGTNATRAGQLFVELGRRQLKRDDASGINYLRRAVGVDPYSKPSSQALEQALGDASKWDELDRILRQRSAVEQDPHERAVVLRRRADLYREQLDDREALVQVLTELVGYEPAGGEAAEELRELLHADQDWEALSRLIEAEINALGADPKTPAETLVAEILELATIAREHMGDRDRAAELLHQALGVSPTHEEALARYVDHFRERRDWRGLIELNEFALDNARQAGMPLDDLVRRLEEIGQLAELRLGDIPRAIDAWSRIGELEPESGKVAEALRRLHSRAKMWDQLVTSLEHDVAIAPEPRARTSALRKMAQTYRERQIEPRRAIELYEEIVAANPEDDATLKALSELYEKEGDDAGLASTLRRQLDIDADRLALAQGKPVGVPLDWPVAKRSERLTTLRRLAILCETRLADVDGVVFACSGVLELLTADRDALERMERVLEKAGDPRLEQTLEYHAAASTSPAERAKLLRRLAKLAVDRGDELAALERWELVLRASPADPEALAALSEMYERAERWPELAQILERLDGGRPLPAPGTPEAAVRALDLERYATVMDVHLIDPARAVKAWHRVLELSPKSRTALDSLTRLYRGASKWRELADMLGRQVPLFASDPSDAGAKAATVALERAEILEERLGAPAEAIKVLEQLIREINPNHLEAHTALRRLHEARGDFDAAVRIAEREMYLAPEPARKVARGLEIGLMCRDRLANPTRALQAFERVLALDPEQDEALAAAADLLAKLGRWKDHVRLLERMLQLAGTSEIHVDALARTEARRGLIQRIAQATAEKLADPRAAFRWLRRAHEEAPDDNTLSDVRRFADGYGLQRELAEVLIEERRRVSGGVDPAQFVALSRELAQLSERRLGDKPRAVAVLAEALAVSPRDPSLLGELERLAAELDARATWKSLIDAYELALAAAVPAQRVELYLRRARILDERVVDPKGAVADVLAAFSWAPDREDLRDILLPLATKARAWNEVIAVDSALIDRAAANAKRVELLRRKASVIEDQLKDAPRAFRTHLVALMLEPDDADTTSHLWRLARVIGRYRETDRVPRAEPASAPIQDPSAYAEASAAASRAGAVDPPRPPAMPGARIPRRAATEPIGDDELSAATANLGVGDSTQPIDLTELEMDGPRIAATKPARGDATQELSPRDLIAPPRAMAAGTAKLPPLPPRPPQIKPRQAPGTSPPAMTSIAPRKSQASIRRAPLPTLLGRTFESPWEEFAQTYESLPAPDPATTLRWLYRAAEVWESGGKDIARAFDTLARAFTLARRAPPSLGARAGAATGVPGGDAEVRARLGRIAQEHKAWDRLAELYEGMAEQADTAASAVDLLMEVANIRTEQKRPRDAEAQLRRILGMLPSDATARARIEVLYRAEGRWVELAASLEERTDPRLGTAAPEAERPQLLRELAAIYTDKLSRPHDAIDAFERLRLLAPTDLDILAKLGELYGAVGRWSKVIETLARVGEIAEGSSEARDALRAIARIYEHELELPDRATEAYNQLIATWPDDEGAWAALDALYAGNAKWAELADVLRRRAALTREPAERAQLLARRAGVLIDWLDSPEEAAAALRHARTVAPDDLALADLLVSALTKSGKDREAAAILEGRIGAMIELAPGAAPRGELAGLYIRLAQLKHDKLEDRAGARVAVDHALALVPEHPTALAVLAGLASPDDDPRAFAEAKLREADSAADDDAKIAALMAAGDVLNARVGEPAAAQAAYERVLALRPYHADATWALAGLVEKGGDPDTAARVLEKRLEDVALVPAEKARLLTQLAALTRAAGVDQAAERRLLEALAAVPDHHPAIIALADFYADAERWTDLEVFLRETLGDDTTPGVMTGAPPALIADLHRRMATAHEKLGRDEDAYQTLVAADRLHRGHLLIKLALGENRYKARRWREAALHLSPLAAHDDAARYPTEVAQGLYHAALAEIRSLRPEKAPPLYARALELKPSYAPALQALAEIAMEQGDHRRAADLLTRQATGTEDAAERMRLFEALGDMALMMLHDDERALTCYAAAVAAAQPLEARHVALLDKLLVRQQLAADHAGAGRTAELMAAFGTTPAERAARHLRAARDYVLAGDSGRARAAADRAVEHEPYDIDAADLASELAINAGDVDAASTTLTRLLAGKNETDPERRALLSYRLGYARAQRGDARQATPAYERAIAIAPRSPGATAARSALVEVLREQLGTTDDPAKRDAIAAHLGAIVAVTGELGDLVAWADELRRGDAARRPDGQASPLTGSAADRRRGSIDAARATLDLAIGAGHHADVHQQAFLSVHKPYALRVDESYRGSIEAADRALIVDRDADPLVALLAPIAATLAEAAALLWSDLDEALARAGAAGARRVPATSHAPATAMFPRLTTALGAGAVMLYQRDDGPDVTVVCGPSPIIVLGPRLAAESASAGESRALLARAVELTRPEHVVFAGLPLEEANRLLAAVARQFGPPALREAAAALVVDVDIQRAHDELVRAALPIRLRSRFEQLLATLPASALDIPRYLAASQRTADRAALAIAGDPAAIVAAATARGDSAAHLIKALADPAWLDLRTKLGVGIR